MTKYKIQLKDAEGNLYYPEVLNSDCLPIGSMIPYSSEVIPNGFLPCDGSEVSRTEYKDLFAVIGITYGEGDGETTFNLPDKRGRVSVGLDKRQEEFNSISLKDGEKEHTLTVDEMPKHNHKHREWVFNGASASGAHYGFGYQVNTGGAYDRDEYGNSGEVQFGNYPTGEDQPHNNLQPYEVDQWIIKAFNGSYSQPVSGDVNDTLPVGSIIEFDGDYIPEGYEEVEKEAEKPIFKLRKVSRSVTVGANTISNFTLLDTTAFKNIKNELPDYTSVSVIPYRNGYTDQWLASISFYGNTGDTQSVVATIRSKYTSSLTNNIEFSIVFVRNDLLDSIFYGDTFT